MEDPTGACIRRIEQVDGDLTEWWASSPAGIEQGWTLLAPPPGSDALAIEVEIEGAQAWLQDGAVWLQADDGAALVVDGLVAWDADGSVLPSWFCSIEGRFGVAVDDREARYPIEIDPIYSTAAWTAEGRPATGRFGVAAESAGDVDGDGYDDIIVGATGYRSYTGRAFVFHGSATGVSETATTTLTGEATSSYFGQVATGIGDVDGDGYDDVAVGAPSYSSSSGRVYLFPGSVMWMSTMARRPASRARGATT